MPAPPDAVPARRLMSLGGAVRRLFRLGLIVWALTVAAVVLLAARYATAYPPEALRPVDAIVVLGGGVDPDGRIAYSTRRRVQAAATALDAGRAGVLILSGGAAPGKETDAARMARFAAEIGVPPERIVREERARTTFENLRFSFALAEARGFERLALASDSHHLPRAALLARYFGRPDVALVAATGLADEKWHDQVHAIGRESFAWWYNLGKVAAWEALAVAGVPENDRREFVQ